MCGHIYKKIYYYGFLITFYSFFLSACGSDPAPPASSATVTTIAGVAGMAGSTDGTGTAARFDTPTGIISDGTSLYITDEINHTIRKMIISTGEVTTLAGTAGMTGSADGTGATARFYRPRGITTDGTNLYVTDTFSNTIRQIVIATGAVTTLAGTAGMSGSTDGTGAAARFAFPSDLVADSENLYVTDRHTHIIRQIVISTGVVSTLAGTAGMAGSTDGTGAAARFDGPTGITTDGTRLYVVDTNNNTIRQIVISTGVVTTLAGTAGMAGSTDGNGSEARFDNPYAIDTDGSNLYVGEILNQTIRQLVLSSGEVTTLAGSAGMSGSTDGSGSEARFNAPAGITNDGTSYYVADGDNHTIRQLDLID